MLIKVDVILSYIRVCTHAFIMHINFFLENIICVKIYDFKGNLISKRHFGNFVLGRHRKVKENNLTSDDSCSSSFQNTSSKLK